MIAKTCVKCGKDYETRYGAKYNPFECPGCVKNYRKLVKSVNCNPDYRGVRQVREPQLQAR